MRQRGLKPVVRVAASFDSIRHSGRTPPVECETGDFFAAMPRSFEFTAKQHLACDWQTRSGRLPLTLTKSKTIRHDIAVRFSSSEAFASLSARHHLET